MRKSLSQRLTGFLAGVLAFLMVGGLASQASARPLHSEHSYKYYKYKQMHKQFKQRVGKFHENYGRKYHRYATFRRSIPHVMQPSASGGGGSMAEHYMNKARYYDAMLQAYNNTYRSWMFSEASLPKGTGYHISFLRLFYKTKALQERALEAYRKAPTTKKLAHLLSASLSLRKIETSYMVDPSVIFQRGRRTWRYNYKMSIRYLALLRYIQTHFRKVISDRTPAQPVNYAKAFASARVRDIWGEIGRASSTEALYLLYLNRMLP